MHFTNCAALAAVCSLLYLQMFVLKLCSSAEADNVLNLFFNFDQK